MGFLRYLTRELGFLPSGTLLKPREEQGDLRSDDLRERWKRASQQARERAIELRWQRRGQTEMQLNAAVRPRLVLIEDQDDYRPIG